MILIRDSEATMASIPAVSLEYLHVPVTGAVDSMPVEIAVIDRTTDPVDDDWHTAAWDDGDAKLLVGPGGDITLPDGTYNVWVRVTATPERPVLLAGLLRII